MSSKLKVTTLIAALILSGVACTPAQRAALEAVTPDPAPPATVEVVDAPLTVDLGSDPPVTECTLPGEHFVTEPWAQCVPNSCAIAEEWVVDRCEAIKP